MVRKSSKAGLNEPTHHVIRIDSYSADYSFGLSQPNEEGPYREYFCVKIIGKIEHVLSSNVQVGTPIDLHLIPKDKETDPEIKPQSVGFMELNKKRLYSIIPIQLNQCLRYSPLLLSNGKADAVHLFGSELKRGRSSMRSFRLVVGFDWNEWADPIKIP